jgi:L-ascorbate metabolism protein UlaG (beta-lactamase superfamily)
MEIIRLGHSSFKLQSRQGKLVTDPFNPEITGLKFPKVEADIVTISHLHPDHNQIHLVGGTPLVIIGPGEYEAKGIKIVGVATFHDNNKGADRGKNTVYRIEIDGISLVHCGDLGHKFDDKQLEILDGVDILMIPVGGFYTIDAKLASEVVSQIEPKIIIPMHYNSSELNQKNLSELAPIDNFLKEMAKEGIVPQPKLVVSKDKLPVEPTVIALE